MATTRSARVLAAGFTASLVLLSAGPALAAPNDTVNGTAFGASATLGDIDLIEPTPLVVLPQNGAPQNETAIPINAAPIVDVGILTASTSGDPVAGTSTATGTVADVEVLPPLVGGTPLPGVPGVTDSALSATAVSATCNATPNGESGSASIIDLQAGGDPVVTDNLGPNTDITVEGLASVVLNEQINNADGSLTVNAIHITLLNGELADIILGSATCGQNVATPPINAIPTAGLPLAAGIVAAFVIGVVVMRRREMGPFAV